MLTHSFRRNMHRATLLTGDLDFKPLVDALVHEGMFVTLWYPPKATNKELIAAADARQKFDIQTVYGCATDALRQEFRMPGASAGPKDVTKSIFQKSWQEPSRGEVELYTRDGDYFLTFKDGNSGNWSRFTHADLEFLRKYAIDVLEINVPQ
jgi:hypothetical protein